MDRAAELRAIQAAVDSGRVQRLEPGENKEHRRWVRAQERKRVSNRTYTNFKKGTGAPPDPYESRSRGSRG